MAFQLSAGVLVTEKDLTNIVPAVATSNGAFAGTFAWGPVLDPTTISSENQLVSRFGKPADGNARSFFTAANFLSYSNNLLVVRVDTPDARNAVASPSGTVNSVVVITDGGTGYTEPTIVLGAPNISGGVQATATLTHELGEITSITIVNPGSGYTAAPSITINDDDGSGFIGTTSVTVGGIKVNNLNDYQDNYLNGLGLVGEFAVKYPGTLGNSITVSMADSVSYGDWAYAAEFDSAPSTSTYVDNVNGTNDELHIIVIDELGLWTGVVGGVLEKFAFVSKASDARRSDGANNFYKAVLNDSSKYVWWMDHPAATNWGSAAQGTAFTTIADDVTRIMSGGVDDIDELQGGIDGIMQEGFALFSNAELYDIQLIPTGGVSASTAKWVIENVVEGGTVENPGGRRDCVAFVSPVSATGEVLKGIDAVEDMIAYRNGVSFNVNSSYAVLDSGYKYQYDRYNDTYRWVPLNGDIAGLCARTDLTNDPWWSPGGLNRGQVKNVVKLAVNPNKTERDNLYKSGINPVVSFPGQGTVLFGDKTLLAKPSAFDRINVRRLFIVMEKAIATAAKYQLFEFNDSFTRAQFKSLVEPFLRDVQGRRGIIDFRVVCDDTNNTGEVIDRNEFIADIYVKPTRSINFITLNFIAARTGISFDEIGG